MKKIFSIIVTILLFVVSAFFMSCSDDSDSSSHEHTLGRKHEAVAGTCVTKATFEYYDCEKLDCTVKLDKDLKVLLSIEGELDPDNHKNLEPIWVHSATTHKKIYDCCDADITEDTPHSFSDWSSDNNASPTKDGTKSRSCSICSYEEISVDEGTQIKSIATRVDENFIKVTGVTIPGRETLYLGTGTSMVFTEGKEITIPDLLVCDHEVTRGEYCSVMGKDEDRSKAPVVDKDKQKLTGDAVLNSPVNSLDWHYALLYCNKLSRLEGLEPCYLFEGKYEDWRGQTSRYYYYYTKDDITCNFEANGYRLPTVAEWEWLALGGDFKRSGLGEHLLDAIAWYCELEDGGFGVGTRVVKTKLPNGYGLYDMFGNVREWCWGDYYADDYTFYSGGSYDDKESACYLSKFYHFNTSTASADSRFGFRVVRTAK